MKYKISHSSDVRKGLRQLEIAFVMDTTSSMTRQIDEAKKQLNYIVNTLVNHPLRPNVKFAAIGFRDHPPEDETYVAKSFCNLDSDISKVQRALNSMSAEGGGDLAEAVADGINLSLDLGWTLPAQKAILLVGDAPPHGAGADDDKFPSGCPCGNNLLNLAGESREMGITTHAIGVGSNPIMIRSFSEFAKVGGGVFVSMDRSADVVPILISRIGEEMGKMAADLRTINKAESGEAIDDADRESLERLEKKGIRILPSSLSGDHSVSVAPKKLRIRVIK